MFALTVRNILFSFFITQLNCVIIPTIPNAKLKENYFVNSFLDGTLHDCADMCVYVTACMSVSFGRRTKTCVMYNTSQKLVPTDEIVRANDFVLLGIDGWPQSRTGMCWNKPCTGNETCVPDGDSYRCNPGIGDGNAGCPPYNFPEIGENLGITDLDGKTIDVPAGSVYPVGSSIKAGCVFPYVPISGGPDAYWRITCYDTMRWESINYKCVSVTELCVHKILENKFYPSRANITVTSSVAWTDTDALLESGLGWIARINDDKQYIQVQFDYPYWIGGLITKGGSYEATGGIAGWVKSYTVSYSWDCSNYAFITKSDQDGSQVSLPFPNLKMVPFERSCRQNDERRKSV